MPKTRTLQVVGNRIQFKCLECGARRMVPVLQNVRRKSVRCHKCGSTLNCIINRRMVQREAQAGKITVITKDGKEIDVDLHDISLGGVGFSASIQGVRQLSLNQPVRFKCSWNPSLLCQGRYVVSSIKGQRVGVQNIDKKFLG